MTTQTLEITVNTDNDAFDVGNAAELSRIVRVVAGLVDNGNRSGITRDINGNTVGSWRVRG